MAWLRLDDGFTKHPKFKGWKPAQKWAFLELMEYCARYDTNGEILDDYDLLPRAVTPALLALAERSGWIDTRPDGTKWVHDWDVYNPPKATQEEIQKRIAEVLERNPKASSTDIYKQLGGRKKDVLEAVRRFRSGSQPVPGTVPAEPVEAVPSSRAHAPAPASRPVPGTTNRGEERPLGATPPLPQLDQPAESAERSPASPSNGRAVDPDEWFGGDQKQKRGKPAEVVGDKPKPFKRKPAEAYVRNVAWLDPHPADALRAQYADIPDDDLIELVELAAELARAHNPSPDALKETA